ncbi:hypothetical protein FRC11_009254, partial [Ceratobasidium sp. 423]
MKALEGEIKQGVASHVEDSVDVALESGSTCATEMKRILAFDVNDEDGYRVNNIPQGFIEASVRQAAPIFVQVISGITTSAENMHRM